MYFLKVCYVRRECWSVNSITIDGYPVRITNPEKMLWPNLEIRKIDYITKLLELAPYILPHARDRLLTTIRFPDGIGGKSFYQKNIPVYAPNWVDRYEWRGVQYILLNNQATLAWLANQAVLEFHTAFNLYQTEDYPTALVFDLDPSEGQIFDEVVDIALKVHETLHSLQIKSWVKTSGATGLQIYIPIEKKYTYETARKLNEFFAQYFSQKFPDIVTIERIVNKRGKKLYFDYLQMWHGKTITMVYSPRATIEATISMPVEWKELEKGITPKQFHLLNVIDRLKKKGDLFSPLLSESAKQNLDPIIQFLSKGKNKTFSADKKGLQGSRQERGIR